jgi:hypothetical protein
MVICWSSILAPCRLTDFAKSPSWLITVLLRCFQFSAFGSPGRSFTFSFGLGPHFQISPLFASKDILAFRLAGVKIAALLEFEFRALSENL